MIRIGILGEIGSGKSYVAKNFGYPVFNADLEVSKIYRKFAKTNFPKEYRNIPLSFLLNNSSIKTVPIGMLSKSSIEKNINIAKNISPTELTKKVSDWCLLNCQIFD